MSNKPHIIGKKCTLCDRKFGFDEIELTCPHCGETGILDVEYDYDYIRPLFPVYRTGSPRRDLFRFAPLLPLALDGPRPQTAVGPTPMVHAVRLGRHVGIPGTWIKDDGRLPTASFKDRASAIAVARAKELGINLIAAASTGNAAASLAGLCAPEGITAVIFVPKAAPPAKIAQLLTFGAQVFLVDGTYDDAFALSLKAADRFGWYLRSTAINPLLAEGKKTGVLEALEELGYDNPPDFVFVSVGDGCIAAGLAKGIMDLHALGAIPYKPRLVGVQAVNSRVIYEAWKAGTETVTPMPPSTRADSISVAFPRDAVKALRGIRATNGLMVTVEDEAIFEAGRLMGTYAGVFAEPAAATAFAGVLALKAEGTIQPHHRCLVFSTGSGLKDVAGASMAAGSARLVTGLADLEKIFAPGS
ncbi:MAG: threonine synthase [Deltaproteobacteria bacterium HGW-Deltaproteobacteria-22]|nr:MAG: threonine synthase [Deltaproteobacteria bacterium HGW-Deltaproteobacteria-22]